MEIAVTRHRAIVGKKDVDNPEAMFYIGRLYQENGDTENANAMFDKIVRYGDSSTPREVQRQEN